MLNEKVMIQTNYLIFNGIMQKFKNGFFGNFILNYTSIFLIDVSYLRAQIITILK